MKKLTAIPIFLTLDSRAASFGSMFARISSCETISGSSELHSQWVSIFHSGILIPNSPDFIHGRCLRYRGITSSNTYPARGQRETCSNGP